LILGELSESRLDLKLSRLLPRLAPPFCWYTIAVAVEQARGALLFALLKYEFLTLYPIHPTTLAHYLEAFSTSRAKDDPTDAEYATELLLHHRDRLTSLEPDDPTTRTLQLLLEQRWRLNSNRRPAHQLNLSGARRQIARATSWGVIGDDTWFYLMVTLTGLAARPSMVSVISMSPRPIRLRGMSRLI